jgi:hypothetical protein
MSSLKGSPRDFKKGLTILSHPSAINILIAGMFLLCHKAAFKVIIQSNLLSALFGLSGHT